MAPKLQERFAWVLVQLQADRTSLLSMGMPWVLGCLSRCPRGRCSHQTAVVFQSPGLLLCDCSTGALLKQSASPREHADLARLSSRIMEALYGSSFRINQPLPAVTLETYSARRPSAKTSIRRHLLLLLLLLDNEDRLVAGDHKCAASECRWRSV